MSEDVVTTEKEVVSTAPAAEPATKRKKVKRSVVHGQVHVYATFNNTIISFTDSKGGVIAASSAGACGFRGSKKGTAYAAQVAVEKAAQIAKQSNGFAKADVFVRGTGLGRDAAIRAVMAQDIQIESIRDLTGLKHGGVRPRKAKRN